MEGRTATSAPRQESESAWAKFLADLAASPSLRFAHGRARTCFADSTLPASPSLASRRRIFQSGPSAMFQQVALSCAI